MAKHKCEICGKDHGKNAKKKHLKYCVKHDFWHEGDKCPRHVLAAKRAYNYDRKIDKTRRIIVEDKNKTSEYDLRQTKVICAWLFGTAILIALLVFIYQIVCRCH